jgi:hypothetical protein
MSARRSPLLNDREQRTPLLDGTNDIIIASLIFWPFGSLAYLLPGHPLPKEVTEPQSGCAPQPRPRLIGEVPFYEDA